MGRRGKGLICGFGRGVDGAGRKVETGVGFDFEWFSSDSSLGI